MADLNALIAQGAQFNLPNPVDQYSKLTQLQAAQQQMQMQRQQMQQIQEDRAGFAKLRETLAQQNLTPEQYEVALTQSPDSRHQQMGVEMRMRRTRLAELEKAMGGAEAVSAPSAMPAPMVAPEASKPNMFVTKDNTGRLRYIVDATEVSPEDYQSAQAGVVVQPVRSFGQPETQVNALASRVAPAVAAAPVANAMVAQPFVAAPISNAMTSKQAQLADISKKLAVLTKPQFSDVAGVKDQIAYLREEQKRLSETTLAKIDPKDYTPDSFAEYMQTNDPTKLMKATDQRLAFDKAKFEWEKANPGKTIKEVTQDGVTKYFAIDNRTGEGTLVTIAGGKVLTGTDIAAQRLAFDQAKFDWEKANPGKTIKEITQNGVTKYFAIDNRTGESTPVTVAGGKILTGTDMASQRLAFDQAKFAWEKANPGFTIQQTEDGSIVGVNNRTLQAYPVTLNAGAPPSPAPFTGIGGVAPTASAGRGSVGITDNRPALIAPAVVPAGVPLKGKSAGLTESQGNATAFGMRMKESHDLLSKLEKAGATDTGIARGVIGGTLGLTPLIGDKLNDATGNIFNALPTVLGGLNEQQQQTINARINFITALLRKESGAAIGPNEFATAEKLYFPKPGDSKSVIEQKQRARELAIQAMKIQAGPGAKNIGVSQDESASSESDPLGIRK